MSIFDAEVSALEVLVAACVDAVDTEVQEAILDLGELDAASIETPVNNLIDSFIDKVYFGASADHGIVTSRSPQS